MAFGQGETLVTPLQEAVAYGTFATGGTRYAPQIVNSIISPTGRLVKRFKPRVTGHVSLPANTYQQILAGLEGTIYNPKGTAYSAFTGYTGMQIAGKTGTATESSNANVQPTAWFVAFGPTTSTPRYVVAVVIDQAGYGAAAAAPVARTIFTYLSAHPVGSPVLRPPRTRPDPAGQSWSRTKLSPRMTTPRTLIAPNSVTATVSLAVAVVACFVLFAVTERSVSPDFRESSRTRRQGKCSRCQSRRSVRAHRRGDSRWHSSTDAARAASRRDL